MFLLLPDLLYLGLYLAVEIGHERRSSLGIVRNSDRNFFVRAIKTSHLPAAIVCAPPLRRPARLAHCALSVLSQVM